MATPITTDTKEEMIETLEALSRVYQRLASISTDRTIQMDGILKSCRNKINTLLDNI